MPGHSAPRPPDATPLSLVTLGRAGLFAEGKTEPVLGPGKPLALLTYLALAPGRRASREFLLDLLWADLDSERARGALRQVLFHLRRLLGEAALPGSEEIHLARPLATDRDQFLAAVERGDLEAAVGTYGGDFLAAFGVPGGAEFEQWADLERHRLRAAFLRTGELAVRRLLNQSRFRDAQRLARRIRDDLPDSEVAWRLVLEATISEGDAVSAALEAEALERWAERDGSPTLDPTTRAMLARARQVTPGTEKTAEPAGLVAELTGREREFAAITAAWDAVRGGATRHLHLVAPAGLGKSRLLRDAVARLRAGGAVVAELRGHVGERVLPYAFAADLVAVLGALPGAAGIAPASIPPLLALQPSLAARFQGTPDPGAGSEALRRRVQAVNDLIQAVAHDQPVALVIDDLHWVDDASFHLLEALFGRIGGTRVFCLSASRPGRLPAGEGIVTWTLAPLTPTQVGTLVTSLGQLPDDQPWAAGFVPGLFAATRGSPLLVLETLRLALDQGLLRREEGIWRADEPARLATLLREGEALRQRVRALPPEAGWILGLLATAGAPLPVEVLAEASGTGVLDATTVAEALERGGLARRVGAGWAPAHDEIADAAAQELEPERRAAASRALGSALAARAGADPTHLLRGLRHLALGGDLSLVRTHFATYARLARTRGDRRPFRQLAEEALGSVEGAGEARALAATLPRRWRIGLWSASRQAAALGSVVVLLTGAAGGIFWRQAREAERQRAVVLNPGGRVAVVPVDGAEWDGRTAPALPRRGSSSLEEAARSFPEYPPYTSPDGRAVAWNANSGDSTTIDIWIRTPAGTRRLTSEPRDDLVTGWLPDGSGLIGLTSRWSEPGVGSYAVAIFDTATGQVRRVTQEPFHHGRPSVSPDGTRIAYTREPGDGLPDLCVLPFDGEGPPACVASAETWVGNFVGWLGLDELLVQAVASETSMGPILARLDPMRGSLVSLGSTTALPPLLSPDRRWILAERQIEGLAGARDWIIPVERPERGRPVGGRPASPGRIRWWEGRASNAEVIDRVEFTDTVTILQQGVGTRLGLRALTVTGAEAPIRVRPTWRSDDTLVATVDAEGVVHPQASGTVTIEASLGGWRSVRRRFEVQGAPVEVVFEERWTSGWDSRWLLRGDPMPTVGAGPDGVPGFWNRGDGVYNSEGLSRRTFSARQGLGVELRLSSPLTRASGQRVSVAMVGGVDTVRFAQPDAISRSYQPPGPACAANYPSGDGEYARQRVAGRSSGGMLIPLTESEVAGMASGDWWTLRLQLFPDGRCGIAINGQPRWLSPLPERPGSDYRLVLGWSSFETRILHGPLQVWTGVRTDIDWAGWSGRR